MGKFSDYIDNMHKQTNLLRDRLTEVSGIDCKDKNIGTCAHIVSNYITDKLVEGNDYKRPDWYPDIKHILNNAPDIVKDGKLYHPCYIMLLDGTESTTPFYKAANYSGSTEINARRGTGGDAILCSDICNDITQASSEQLEVGTTILHSWDTSRYFTNPENKDEKVCWAVIYTSNSNKELGRLEIHGYDVIEFISGDCIINSRSFYSRISYSTSMYNYSCKYIEFQYNTIYTEIGYSDSDYYLSYFGALEYLIINSQTEYIGSRTGSYSMANLLSLRYIELPSSLLSITSSVFLQNSFNLSSVIIPGNADLSKLGANAFSYALSLKTLILSNNPNMTTCSIARYSGLEYIQVPDSVKILDICYMNQLKEIEIPEGVTELGTYFLTGCPKVRKIKLPKTVSKIAGLSSSYVSYIELYEDFNISGLSIAPSTSMEKQWLKDLCGWLKDRTDETAGTMRLSLNTVLLAQSIYLTFNPDNKRDITLVTRGTAGAISIHTYLTQQLNWTISS